ncbi:MAG: histidinol-phosphate transaminase [Coriobacteriia bacterium]|nr:histidinol-phosphate transaminase [Coriobacteriia bacterium]MCL2749616.1 histidinol-phosphate transaminase [Coriobacteriia bacterium]
MDWNSFFKKELEPMQPYQPGLREEQILEIAETSVIHKLSSNESPFPPFPSALAAMQACLPKLNEYCDGSCYDLKQGLVEHYQVPYEQIMVGNGTNELLMLLAEACLAPGSRVAYCWPSFIVYRMAAQITGAAFDEVPLTSGGRYDLEALLAAIKPETKLVFINSPNNPTGGIVKQEEFERFMARVPEHVLVVLDMAYYEYVTDLGHMDPMSWYDGKRPIAVLYSFSKIYGLAGVRVGYGFAPEPVIKTIDKVREPFNVNAVGQVGALASLGQHAELERRCRANALQRARLCEGFERLGLKYFASHANFIWVFVPDSEQTFQELLKQGVIVRPFAVGGGLRVTVGNEENTRATIAAFERLFAESGQV